MMVPSPSSALDWALDRSVVGGYTSIGYRLRGLAGQSPDPDGNLERARVLVTGANGGIGAAATESFAALGAEVHMVARDRGRGEDARARISERTGSDRLHLHLCDLADLEQIDELATGLTDELDGLDCLVHNAGAMFSERRRSPQGHELTLALHVLGPFLLTHRLAPLLAAGHRSPGGRVIFVTSGGAYTERLDPADPQLQRRDFDGSAFYAHAKRAQIVLTGELDRRLGAEISVHSMHPGWAATQGVADSLPTFNKVLGPLLRSAPSAADTIVWLAADDRPEREPGRLWMDRRPRPEHRVPWTEEQEGDAALLYERCAELVEIDPLPHVRDPDRGPTGAARVLPSP
jgi:NAD(P)-dependent dehydrogenase (short-subunit alcohol dehydrogenase family)